jgi:hypothetical protein
VTRLDEGPARQGENFYFVIQDLIFGLLAVLAVVLIGAALCRLSLALATSTPIRQYVELRCSATQVCT